MELAEIAPDLVSDPEYCALVDKTYDWNEQRNIYTPFELEKMIGWIEELKSESLSEELETECPFVSPDQLNQKQRFAFNIVEDHYNISKQLLMILTGTAGSGKSFTVYAISTFLNGMIRRAAPTAKAAFLIKGETLHALLDLQSNNNNKSDHQVYQQLTGDKLRRAQERFHGIKYLVVDEFSMIHQNMFAYMDQRLRQITQNVDQYFGGISLILTGKFYSRYIQYIYVIFYIYLILLQVILVNFYL